MFAHPDKNVERLGIEPGMKVADLGTGSGHYALAAARLIGVHGRVYAVDVVKDMLSRLKKEAEQSHLHNIDVVWGNAEKLGGTTLRDASVDRVIMSNVLFQLEDRAQIGGEVRRILKPGGLALIIDWTGSFGMMGPHPDRVVADVAAKAIFEKAGLAYEREFSAGDHHYGLVFKR